MIASTLPSRDKNLAVKQSFNAEIAQLVEHNLAKVGVASSSLVFRSFFCEIIIVGEVAEW